MRKGILIAPRDREIIRERVYPFSEASPLNNTEKIVDKVQIETAKAQVIKLTERMVRLIQQGYIPGEDADILIQDIQGLK